MEAAETEKGRDKESMESPVKRFIKQWLSPSANKKKTTRAKWCCWRSRAIVTLSWTRKTQVLKRQNPSKKREERHKQKGKKKIRNIKP